MIFELILILLLIWNLYEYYNVLQLNKTLYSDIDDLNNKIKALEKDNSELKEFINKNLSE